MTARCTAESFAEDVRRHRTRVIHADGASRHIRFSRPSECIHWFELVTWPGSLTITGDMGTYVFKRTEDMFEFFRRPDNGINESYWSEKCVAVGTHDPMQEWCRTESRKQLAEYTEDWPSGARHEAFDQLDPEAFDSEQEFRAAVDAFSEDVGGQTFEFCDFWEWDLSKWSYRFIWCLRAIAWGIQKFDALPAQRRVS